MESLKIIRPDDWHVHLRDGNVLQDTVNATACHFERALVMPNLRPALTSISSLLAYRDRILAVLNKEYSFSPMMTFYLNEEVLASELIECQKYPYILGAKLYPAGATTNSEAGVRSLKALYPLLDIMQQQNLVLQIHGETTQDDIFDREAAFIVDYLQPLIRNFPKLRIVLEHISTRAAVDFVQAAPETIAATITPHHLLYNRNQLLAGGLRPHYYCLPVLKRATDQAALQEAAISQNPKFFAGTDSAPHSQSSKESVCGCAGIYSAPFAVALYAEIFERLHKLSCLNGFLSEFGANFYQLPVNKSELHLIKRAERVPQSLPLGQEKVVPMAAGEELLWSIHESH